MVMETSELNEIKKQVQNILDRHLKPEERFSIQDLDEDSVFLLIDLLNEKDDKKREKIREEVHQRIINLKLKLRLTTNSVMKIKDTYNCQKEENRNLGDLMESINDDNTLNDQLAVI